MLSNTAAASSTTSSNGARQSSATLSSTAAAASSSYGMSSGAAVSSATSSSVTGISRRLQMLGGFVWVTPEKTGIRDRARAMAITAFYNSQLLIRRVT